MTGSHRTPARLGVGAVSRNTVDACIELALRHRTPMMLVASRSQVESSRLGGGYVEGWSADDVAHYVRRHDPGGLVLLCRDHGGPWQHPRERTAGCDDAEAMASCLASLVDDIDAGFHLLHIDTCLDRHGFADHAVAMDRLVTLIGECSEAARSRGRPVRFEVGWEDQRRTGGDAAEFRALLSELADRLAGDNLPMPTFVVAQTGTKVEETENTGEFDTATSATVAGIARACSDLRADIKAHNVDYVSVAVVRGLFRCGVGAVNVAPEFGVAETRALLRLLDELELGTERERFLQLAYTSGNWRKWMKVNSAADDVDRAVIAGHYVFGTATFLQIKEEVVAAARRRGIDVDAYLRGAVAAAIRRYLRISLEFPLGEQDLF